MGQKIIKEYVMKPFDHALASPSIEKPVKPVQQSELSWRATSFSFSSSYYFPPRAGRSQDTPLLGELSATPQRVPQQRCRIPCCVASLTHVWVASVAIKPPAQLLAIRRHDMTSEGWLGQVTWLDEPCGRGQVLLVLYVSHLRAKWSPVDR